MPILITINSVCLYSIGVEEPPKEFDGPVMRRLIDHTQNHERESRLQQPNLQVTEWTFWRSIYSHLLNFIFCVHITIVYFSEGRRLQMYWGNLKHVKDIFTLWRCHVCLCQWVVFVKEIASQNRNVISKQIVSMQKISGRTLMEVSQFTADCFPCFNFCWQGK